MFLVSKFVAWLTQPLAWAAAMMCVGLLLQRRSARTGWRFIWAALITVLVMGWQPLPDVLMRQLEKQYAEIPPQADLSAYTGVIVLGGAMVAGHVAQAHTQPVLNGAAERMTAPLAMLMRNPKLKLVFTGGEGFLFGIGPSEADRAKVFFESMGVPTDRVQYESASRNTLENAILTAQLPGMDIKQRWLLVTSATHMPRSMATFTNAGWNVTAYPVDFQTGEGIVWSDYSLAEGARNWQLLLHELLGLMAYWVTGRL
jgi:uncharacterized SAM-binding protein YcdF (DUF218 family)